MSTCTDFCESLKVIDLTHGVLPSHDELLAHLQVPADNPEHRWLLGTWQELLQRTQCGLCQLVVAAISNSEKLSDIGVIPPNHPISILVFPGEQSFRLSYPSRLGLRLAFVTEDHRHVRGADTARPVHEARVQTSRIISWLTTCDMKHKACSLETVENEPNHGDILVPLNFRESVTSNFRLIDLDLGCVTPAALDIRYVALSYVWGQQPMFRLQTDNFKDLSAAGSLEAIRTQFPRTVNDAIDFVKAMGERYLWIDGLCLVQDDEDDVNLGIEMMNSIYHGSYFTIVASSGVDASSGLPGVGETVRGGHQMQVIKEVAPGIKMTVLHSIDWHLSRSIYNRRGWTLQELVLPRRTVIFINQQVYFRCQEANWSEESWADKWTHWLDADDSNISRIPDFDDGRVPSLWAYQKMCEEYSRRKLRNDGDALRALAGISRPLASSMETPMVEGLPGYYLDHILLFSSSNGDLRRRPEFASFSWAGWEGRIMWPRENFVWHDGNGKRTWKTTNILKYFKHNRIVEWHALDSRAHLENLTLRSWEMPSLLLNLMRNYPHVFAHTEEDPEKVDKGERLYTSSGSHSDIPAWELIRDFPDDDRESQERAEERQRRRPGTFSIKRFNLANGQAEFDRLRRLLHGVDGQRERMVLQNWMAGRHYLVRRAHQGKSAIGSRPIYKNGENDQYRFRVPRAVVSERVFAITDQRLQHGTHQEEQAAEKGQALPNTFKIPMFPPYTILHFRAISIHLILGAATDRYHHENSSVDRIPGISLLSASGELVGSLHPDNLGLLEAPGSTVECLIVSHCNTPAMASAFGSDSSDMEKPWDLFWILHVVWKNGIAERRGVGQVRSSALENAAEPKPEVKLVLLG